MEKYLSAAGYWLGLVCTVLAIISRVLIAFNSNPPRIGVSDGGAVPRRTETPAAPNLSVSSPYSGNIAAAGISSFGPGTVADSPYIVLRIS